MGGLNTTIHDNPEEIPPLRCAPVGMENSASLLLCLSATQ